MGSHGETLEKDTTDSEAKPDNDKDSKTLL